MKFGRFLALLTALVLLLSAAGPALAVGGGVHSYDPIYIGNAEVDYMADQVLAQIPTAGKTDREKILAVYTWMQENCSRSEWNGTLYFDEAQVRAALPAYTAAANQAIDAGRASVRRQFQTGNTVSFFYGMPSVSFDSNTYIAYFAGDMFYTRCGNCAHFSAMLTVLLEHLGFDCRLIDGAFRNRNGSTYEHKWNCVLIDGQYYWLDVRIDHAEYTRSGKVATDYFLLDSTETWAERHDWDHEYSDWLFANAADIAGQLGQSGNQSAGQSTQPAAQSTQPSAQSGPWSRCSGWAEGYLTEAYAAGLLPDCLLGSDMTAPISRAEFAAAAVCLYESLSGASAPAPQSSPFRDTSDPAVLQAYTLGVVQGVGEGRFAPDATLTREQAATMLGRVCELAFQGAVGTGAGLSPQTLTFSDAGSIGDWARSYIGFFAAMGILDGMGNGRFAPQGTMTREQALKVAVVCLQKLG